MNVANAAVELRQLTFADGRTFPLPSYDSEEDIQWNSESEGEGEGEGEGKEEREGSQRMLSIKGNTSVTVSIAVLVPRESDAPYLLGNLSALLTDPVELEATLSPVLQAIAVSAGLNISSISMMSSAPALDAAFLMVRAVSLSLARFRFNACSAENCRFINIARASSLDSIPHNKPCGGRGTRAGGSEKIPRTST